MNTSINLFNLPNSSWTDLHVLSSDLDNFLISMLKKLFFSDALGTYCFKSCQRNKIEIKASILISFDCILSLSLRSA